MVDSALKICMDSSVVVGLKGSLSSSVSDFVLAVILGSETGFSDISEEHLCAQYYTPKRMALEVSSEAKEPLQISSKQLIGWLLPVVTVSLWKSRRTPCFITVEISSHPFRL